MSLFFVTNSKHQTLTKGKIISWVYKSLLGFKVEVDHYAAQINIICSKRREVGTPSFFSLRLFSAHENIARNLKHEYFMLLKELKAA